MVNPNEDYEQDKIKGDSKQTIIIDERETGETDELDPKFSDQDASATDPEITPVNDTLDGEGIDEAHAGLNTPDRGIEHESATDDRGLNRDANDDLSLNKPQDDLF
jgi:hypothetical protein